MRFGSHLVSACIVVSIGLVGLSREAAATVHNVQVLLDGLQEVPPVATTGFGSADVSFDDVTGQMIVSNGLFQDLVGNRTDQHVHGYAGVGGGPVPVIIPLSGTGGTSGTFSGSGTIPMARIADVMNGLTYLNIHSTFRPGGEIRGQIFIPEPSSTLLAFLAGGVVALRRRR